ncbi:MAG: MBL fold metallo-hydrolase [Planctomycetota bacterium]
MADLRPDEVFPGKFGDWRVQTLACGRFALDGGAMFGAVPRVLWERRIAPDAAHRIPMAMRLLLVRHRSGRPTILVDAGVGDKFDAAFRDRFAIEGPQVGGDGPPLFKVLAAAGVSPGEVTDVVITHLHFDHGGGFIVRESGGDAVPAFPGARHYLQGANLDTAEHPNPRERASYIPENFRPLREIDLVLLEGGEEIRPGIRLIPSHGHTAGMQTVRVEGGGRVLHYLADLAPTHHHLHIPFTMGYDICAREIMLEKERLLRVALEEEALLIFEHDPHVEAAIAGFDRGKYRALRAGRLESGRAQE